VQLWRIQPDAWELVTNLGGTDETNTNGDVTLLSGERILTTINAPARCTDCSSSVIVWDTNGQMVYSLPHPTRISGAAYNQTAERILSYTDEGLLSVWDAETGEEITQIPHDVALDSASWNLDGTQILVTTSDERIMLWQATGEIVFSEALPEGISGAAFSNTGQYLAAWGWDQLVYIWDNSGVLQSILEPQETVTGVWAEDTDLLFTSASSGNLGLYAADGTALASMRHDEQPTDFFLSEDGTRVITRGADFGQRWLVDLPQLLALGQQLAVRDLDENERTQFFLFDGQ
jgi:WD40 repeat protein